LVLFMEDGWDNFAGAKYKSELFIFYAILAIIFIKFDWEK